jgi:hypothetical protein
MNDQASPSEPQFHLPLEQDEVPVARTALNLLISEEAHEPPIRPLAREVLAGLDEPADEHGIVRVTLTPPQMKITHTAVKLLHDDLRYEHADERELLRRILDKLPDEHTMRVIAIE